MTEPVPSNALVLLNQVVREVQRVAPTRELAEQFVDEMHVALARAETIDDVKTIRDKTERLELLYRRQRAELVATNMLAALRLQTERTLGEFLEQHIHAGGNGNNQFKRAEEFSPDVTIPRRKLADLGITHNQSSKWQKIAQVDDEDFRMWLDEGLRGKRELTTNAALGLYIELVEPQVKERARAQYYASLPPFKKAERLKHITIIHGDARKLPEAAQGAHLVFLSPPYNVGIEYAEHDDSMDPRAYEALLRKVFRECFRALVDGGRIGVVTPFGVGRNPYVPLTPLIQQLLVEQGFMLRGQITWNKGTTGGRTTWGSWMSWTNPAIRDTTECITVAHKRNPVLEARGAASLVETGEEYMALTLDEWCVIPESAARVKHPAPFPAELAKRFIKLFGFRGCKVLDPFMGSGSTLIAAAQLDCEAVGVDTSADYCALASARVKKEVG